MPVDLTFKNIGIALMVFLLLTPTLLFQLPVQASRADGIPVARGNEHRSIDFYVAEIPNSAGEGFEPHILAGPSIVGEEWYYIDSPTGWLGGQSGNLWISKDKGDSWEAHPYGRNAGGSGDSYTAVTKDGTIYYTDLYLWSSTIDISTDGGETWLRNPLATVTRLGDRQWLALGPRIGPGTADETLYMIYNDIPQGLIIQRMKWTALGYVWEMGNLRRPVTTSTGSRDYFCVDQTDGTIYCPNKDGGGIAIYVSTDGANSFTRHQVLSTNDDIQNIFIASDVDMEGNVYLAWSDQWHVFMGVSSDKGQTWKITQVTDTNGTRVLPWITVGDPGRAALTWYDTTDTEKISDEKADEVKWGAYAAITTNALDDNSTFLITPFEEYVHSGSIRTTGTAGNADRDLGDFFTCDVDEDGRLIITYGADYDDGPGARLSVVKFAKQLEGPFLRDNVGPVASFENTTIYLDVKTDAKASYDLGGNAIVNYEWDWGDGNTSTGIMGEHSYEKPGTYQIKLKVTNELDMSASFIREITVSAQPESALNPLFIVIPAGLIIVGSLGIFIYIKKKKK